MEAYVDRTDLRGMMPILGGIIGERSIAYEDGGKMWMRGLALDDEHQSVLQSKLIANFEIISQLVSSDVMSSRWTSKDWWLPMVAWRPIKTNPESV